MADVIDFVLEDKIPNLFSILKFEREPSAFSLIKAEYKLKQLLEEEVPRHFDPYLEFMEKYCGKGEAVKGLKDRVEEMAGRYWWNLVLKTEAFNWEYLPYL
jgi:hypothetical protein